ncbi:MAG TPA: hypothetical protein VKB78_06315 [Pirellulales bacterium]|nr:hypothetical protein [Pirellulales bacterium]
MNEMPIALTANERDLIIWLLDRELGDTRAEFRRTHFSPEFREDVEREEKLLREVLEKLRATAGAATPVS